MWIGSGIRKKLIPDPGVKKAQYPGSGSLTKTSYLRVCVGERNIISLLLLLLVDVKGRGSLHSRYR
jgi:hypothetical protein